MAGKGDKRRPSYVPKSTYTDNHDRVFISKKKRVNADLAHIDRVFLVAVVLGFMIISFAVGVVAALYDYEEPAIEKPCRGQFGHQRPEEYCERIRRLHEEQSERKSGIGVGADPEGASSPPGEAIETPE